MSKAIYFDIIGGAGGDMLFSSLVGLGVKTSYLKDTFKKLGLKRLCCKRMFLTNVDITDKLMEYNDISFPNIEYKQEQTTRTYGTF